MLFMICRPLSFLERDNGFFYAADRNSFGETGMDNRREGRAMMDKKNGLEDYYITKDQKRLRYGYTTGSCAAAAAKAAAGMLLMKKQIHRVDLMTPKGILLHLDILNIEQTEQTVTCAVQKDGGDDPDVTHGLLIYAKAEKTEKPGVSIEGGNGVGRVTRKGLEQPIGAAAINRVPREMIIREVQEICEEQDYHGGISVTIWVPKGAETAGKTFNPRLGIEGGISILGTSGIVVPMSEDALVASIRIEMKMRHANGADYLLITPGNYGEEFLKKSMTIDLSQSMKCSNYIGETLDMAAELGLKGILFVSHIGKFIKVSGGIMNTHSKCADSRAELMTAQAIRAGASLETAKKLLASNTTEEAIEILQKENMVKPVMRQTAEQIYEYMQQRCKGTLQTEAILFSNAYGFLGETSGAEEMLKRFMKHQGDKDEKTSKST